MNESRNDPEEDKATPHPRRSEAFGKNMMGVSHIAPDFYENLPLEFLLGEDDPQPSGGNVGGGG